MLKWEDFEIFYFLRENTLTYFEASFNSDEKEVGLFFMEIDADLI